MSIPASVAPPVPPGFQGKGGRSRRDANLLKYGTPLPILLPSSPLHPSNACHPSNRTPGTQVVDPTFVKEPESWVERARAGLKKPDLVVPAIVGRLDQETGSVWVEGEGMEVLFNRGFFGKGTLSRSDPNWRKRRVELVKGGDAVVAEQVREKRRLERKQFKIDRAAAMLDAAKKAEAVLVTGVLPPDVAQSAAAALSEPAPESAPESESAHDQASPDGGKKEDENEAQKQEGEDVQKEERHEAQEKEGEQEGEDEEQQRSRPASPTGSTLSAATIATNTTAPHILPDGTKLNAQTFLVRPARPESSGNRSRGKFKRRPPKPASTPADPSAPAPAPTGPAGVPPPPRTPKPQPKDEEEDELALDLVPESEHLQLSLEEAWFLCAIGVLRLEDDAGLIPTSAVLTRLLTPLPAQPGAGPEALAPPAALYPDDPLLVNYAAYHHYRSLGWCVRHGIKFCVDWLLYRRGPVFSHSAFSILLVPVYMREEDRQGSPYGESEWMEEKTSWKWVNTVMRVNSLVQKTVILAYVTIPSVESFPASARLPGGGLDPRKLDMRSLMSRYTVREVSLTRFSAARRRD